MENRQGLCIDLQVTAAVGVTESATAVRQIQNLVAWGLTPKSAGGDKGSHTKELVGGCRALGVAPHVAEIKDRQVAGLDGRTTKAKGYQTSQRLRKRIEEIFGWMKPTGGLRKTRYRGVERTHGCAPMVAATDNLVRMAKLAMGGPPLAEEGA